MSTTTWNNVSENKNSSGPNVMNILFFGVCLFIVLFFGFFVFWLNNPNSIFSEKYIIDSYVDLTPAQIRIIEVVSGHAWESHGLNASKALDCLGRLGSKKSLKTTGFTDTKTNKPIPTFAWLCQDVDNSWYAIITTEFIQDISKNNVARLVTAYKISRDLFPEIGDYLMYIGEKWGASYISKIIGAGQIYL